jgi:hydroxyacylglutathione hydrolase
MFFKQYYLGCLAHASYMIADEDTHVAAVVDPQRDIEQYLNDARAHGFKIGYVLLTHFHADFLAGHIELRHAAGAEICLGKRAEAEFHFIAVDEDTPIELGDQVQLQFLETPGHTPEGISILVVDRALNPDAPHAVLTGDTLFIGDVGRPDLFASIGVSADELAEMLYDSIHNKLAKLPDKTLVYPAHGAGSLCGRNLSDETVSTIGVQKEYNYAMQPMTVEQFKSVVLADQPDAPDYFAHDAMLNRQERSSLSETIDNSMNGLGLESILRHQTRGTQIVDVRDGIDFAYSHLAGSINIGLRGKFATWSGTLLNKDRPIIVIADPGDEREAIMRLGRIGFDNVVGYMLDGIATVGAKNVLLKAVDRITAKSASQEIHDIDPPVLLDVRSERERESGRVADSLNIPLNQFRDRMDEIPRDRPLIVQCAGGYRSTIACSLLAKNGFIGIQDFVGGFNAWKASGLPVDAAELTS